MRKFFIKHQNQKEKINTHKHSWELIFKSQSDPVNLHSMDFKNLAIGLPGRIFVGGTDLLFECECGELRKEHLAGFEVDDSELGKSFELADRYGHSVVKHSGKRYVIMPAPERYPVRTAPAVAQSSNAPPKDL